MKRKVALVTGSNRGIGKSCIEDFARAGVNVVINYCHHEDEAEELEKYIKENYDVEHTLSYDTVLEDLEILCRRNGGNI